MLSGAKQGDQDILLNTVSIKQDTVAQQRAVAPWVPASFSEDSNPLRRWHRSTLR
jgi:hypothetical protein